MRNALEIGEADPIGTPKDEIQHVADYQEGWNDAQKNRPHKFSATIYYSMGFVDGAYVIGGLQ